MASKLLLLTVQALAVSAGFIDALDYHPVAPLPTGFEHKIQKRQDVAACTTVFQAINSCESVTPGFTTMAEAIQARCLCYSGSSWIPGNFDNAIETCAEVAKTYSPSDYSAIIALDGFCTSVGNVVGSATRTSARASSAAVTGTALPSQCSIANAAIEYCDSVSPGFISMPVSKQAPCLCYSSTSFYPDFFDGNIATCIKWASSASPSEASILNPLLGFCSSAGDILGPATASATITRSGSGTITGFTSRTRTTQASATGLAANSDCAFVGSAIAFCESVSPGFTSMEASSQAPCLCYSSASWSPDGFDDPVSSCANFVKTGSPSDYQVFSNLAGFCSDVGDVSAQATGGSNTQGGGLGGLPADVFPGASTTSTSTRAVAATPTSTVTITPTSSAAPGAGVHGVAINGWALKLVSVVLVVLI